MAPPNSNARGSGVGARGKDRCLLPPAFCRLSLQGQSIFEYLLLITLLVLAILAIRDRVETAVDNLYNAATDKIDEAATDLRGM